jgi:hypothetical protein
VYESQSCFFVSIYHYHEGRASKKNFAKRNKTALRPQGQTETSTQNWGFEAHIYIYRIFHFHISFKYKIQLILILNSISVLLRVYCTQKCQLILYLIPKDILDPT